MKFKSGYYAANCMDGIFFIGTIAEDVGECICSPLFFANYLDNLGRDESIVTFFDDSTKEIFDKVCEKFGVKI